MKRVLVLTFAAFLTSGGVAVAQTFNCDSPPPAVIDDGYDGTLASMACCTITASDFGSGTTITDVDALVSVQNTWVGDVVIKVVSPQGTITSVQSRAGFAEPADDGEGCCGNSADWLGDTITYDDDGGDPSAEDMGAAGSPICNGGGGGGNGVCAHTPFPDAAPGTNLADFDGENLVGSWQVCVGDSAAGDPTSFVDAAITLGAVPVELQSFTIQ
jgi:subtilisin-like proprotein convertase family protein